MISLPFVNVSVPSDQYENEAKGLGSDIYLKTITPQEALAKSFETIILSDRCIHLADQIKASKKYVWIIEPPSINLANYQAAYAIRDKVDLIFSHTKEFLDQIENGVYCPWGSYFVKPEDHKVYDKKLNTTIIASSKRQAPGHLLRHEVISKYGDLFDCVRKGGTDHGKYQNTGDEYKLNFLKDYRFSVEIENANIPGYFTEKLLDCMRTGTIPIYMGDPDISDKFDMDGVITFKNIGELKDILQTANENLYSEKIEAVRNNFITAHEFLYPWRVITNKYYELSQSI